MKKFLLLSLLCLFGVEVDIYSAAIYTPTVDTNKIEIAYTIDQQKYFLNYGFINEFPELTLNYSVGELSLFVENTRQRIGLRQYHDKPNISLYSPSQSTIDSLCQRFRSDDFIVHKNASCQFFIQTAISISSSSFEDSVRLKSWKEISKNTPDSLKQWACPKNLIKHRMEWIVELVSSVTGERLMVLDSSGFLPNPDSNMALPISDHLNTRRLIKIPDKFKDLNVFVRVIQRSYGNSDYNLKALVMDESYNSQEIGEIRNVKQRDYRDYQFLKDYLFRKAVEYMDSLVPQTNCFPRTLYRFITGTKGRLEEMYKRYPNINRKDFCEKGSFTHEFNKMAKLRFAITSPIQSIRYLDKTKEFEVELNSKNASKNMTFKLSATDNTESASGSIGNLKPGEHSFKIPMPHAAKGVYNLSIEDESGKLYGQTTLMVE